MIWKKFPHVAEENSEIFVQFNEDARNRIVKKIVSKNFCWKLINKWCYVEEMEEFLQQRLKSHGKKNS